MQSPSKIDFARNRIRLCMVLILLFLIISAAIDANTTKSEIGVIHAQQSKHTHYQPAGTIDGAIDPSSIPDNKAYSLLFRFLSNRSKDRDKRLAQTLIKDMGVRDEDINVLIAIAEEFNQLVSQLDHQAIEFKQRNRLNYSPEIISRLTFLNEQKESIITNAVSSLPSRLHQDSLENLRRYLSEIFKRQMKIVPAG